MLHKLKKLSKRIINNFTDNKLRSDYNRLLDRLTFLEAQVDAGAKQLEVAKSSFLKNIYHEIRTPLNAIIGFTNLLNKDHLLSETEKDEYASLLNTSSREFLLKIDDIIQASLLEAKMINIDVEACNLHSFFSENHSYFSIRKHNANKNEVALLLSFDENLKNKDVFIDKFRVTQILTHFIDNAFKYTDKGVVEYGCYLKNGMLEFFVKDNSEEDLRGSAQTIFKRFTKIHTIDEQRPGLGLGLAICSELVNLMGGEIWFAPNKDRLGNTFCFSIPMETTDIEKSCTQDKVHSKITKSIFGKKQSYLAV